MKKIYHVLLLLTTFPLAAQNWSPVTLTDTFHFRHDGDAILSASFHVVSFTANAGDTTFQFNTIGCDSCLTYPGGPYACTTCYGLLNQPQAISGYSIYKQPGGICTFTGAHAQTLETQIGVGGNWVFDATLGLTAQLMSETYGTVLGQPDSIKTAVLSNGDSILWSKNYGLVQWPDGAGAYYRLAGIQGRNLGARLLGMKDYFDFNVGDMFEYVSEYTHTAYDYSYYRQKITITSRQINGDTLRYGFQGMNQSMSYNYNGPPNNQTTYWHGPVNGTLVYIDSIGHAGNSYNHQMLHLDAGFTAMQFMGAGGELYTDDLWYETKLFEDSLQIPGVTFGGDDPVDSARNVFYYGTQGSRRLSTSDTTAMVNDGVNIYPAYIYTACTFEKGLGQTRCNFGQFGYLDGFIYSEALTAYRKGNDTVGVFTPDGVLLGMETPSFDPNTINIFPNPANVQTVVSVPFQAGVSVCVYNSLGEMMLHETMTTDQLVLHTENWAKGMYVIEVQTANGVARKKLVVDH